MKAYIIKFNTHAPDWDSKTFGIVCMSEATARAECHRLTAKMIVEEYKHVTTLFEELLELHGSNLSFYSFNKLSKNEKVNILVQIPEGQLAERFGRPYSYEEAEVIP